jgi:hypothetical protein
VPSRRHRDRQQHPISHAGPDRLGEKKWGRGDGCRRPDVSSAISASACPGIPLGLFHPLPDRDLGQVEVLGDLPTDRSPCWQS